MIGRTLDDRYRIVALLARGGMGRIYRAEQAPLDRPVALKVIDHAESGQDPEFHTRFMREAAACARLSHPNTIRVYDYGQSWDGVVYLVMELLDGITLHQLIREAAPLDPDRVIHIGRQICASLAEAHRLGMVHRDLKPSNIMLLDHGDEGDFVKVLDFGLVKDLHDQDDLLTRADAVVGSPSYMSPEQIRSGQVDQRSDLYSVGVLLYAGLTGRTPFAGSSSVNVLMAHLSSPVPSMAEAAPGAGVPSALEQVVRRCLEKDPHDRFADADELSRALRAARAEVSPLEDPSPPSVPREPRPADLPEPPSVAARAAEVSIRAVPRPRRRARLPLLLGAGLLFLLAWVAAGGFAWWLAGRMRAPGPEAAIPTEPAPVAAPPPEAPPAAAPDPAPVETDVHEPPATPSPPRRAAPAPLPAPAAPLPAESPPEPPPPEPPPPEPPPPEPAPHEPEPAPPRTDLRDPWREAG